MSMSLIEIDIEKELLNLTKDDESVSSFEDDGGTIDTDNCSIYSKPAPGAAAAAASSAVGDEDDRKPAAKRTADEAFAGDINEFAGDVVEI